MIDGYKPRAARSAASGHRRMLQQQQPAAAVGDSNKKRRQSQQLRRQSDFPAAHSTCLTFYSIFLSSEEEGSSNFLCSRENWQFQNMILETLRTLGAIIDSFLGTGPVGDDDLCYDLI